MTVIRCFRAAQTPCFSYLCAFVHVVTPAWNTFPTPGHASFLHLHSHPFLLLLEDLGQASVPPGSLSQLHSPIQCGLAITPPRAHCLCPCHTVLCYPLLFRGLRSPLYHRLLGVPFASPKISTPGQEASVASPHPTETLRGLCLYRGILNFQIGKVLISTSPSFPIFLILLT